jgi:hypothetical protein
MSSNFNCSYMARSLKGTHPRTIPARLSVIWFSGLRGEDLNVTFYQNMPNLHNRYKSAEKTLTVTVTKNPDDDEALRITTADVSTPENTDKVITLITNKSDTNLFPFEPPVKAPLKDSDINTISIISGFKGRGFEG